MPIVAVNDNDGGIAYLRMLKQFLFDLGKNLAFNRLARSVRLVYLLRKPVCGLGVVAEQKLERAVGGAHSARRIDARRNRKRHGSCVDIFITRSGNIEKFVYAGARAVVDAAESRFDYRAVLAGKIDNIAYSTYCGEVCEVFYDGCIVLELHSTSQLERDARSAQLLKRAAAIRTLKIDYCLGAWQNIGNFVVVGYNDLHAELIRTLCSVRGADSVIDGNYQLSAHIFELFDRTDAQTVALGQPVRDIPQDIRAL